MNTSNPECSGYTKIGRYSRKNGDLVMSVPKFRRVNGRYVPYDVKIYSNEDCEQIPIEVGQTEIRKDLQNETIELRPTSSRAGDIVTVEK